MSTDYAPGARRNSAKEDYRLALGNLDLRSVHATVDWTSAPTKLKADDIFTV